MDGHYEALTHMVVSDN